MISLGPGSFDMPVEAAVPPGGIEQAALGHPGAAPFEAVLETLMDEIENAGLSIATDMESFADGEVSESDAQSDESVNLAELVNPLAIAPTPIPLPLAPVLTLSLTPMQVLALTGDAPASMEAAPEPALSLDVAATVQDIESVLAEDDTPGSQRPSEPPAAFDDLVTKDPADASAAKAPVSHAAAPVVSELAPGAQVEAVASQNNIQPAESPRVKPQLSARPSRTERVRAESPRIDETPMRPFTVQAVDRAYASSERDTPRSFDQPRDIVQESRSALGRPAASAPFVAAEAPGLHLGSKPDAAIAVDAPGAVDQAAETHLPQQIVQSIRLQAAGGGGEAVLRLRPEYLGEVVIAVKVDQGAVSAALQADTPAVRQWVERNEGVLRQALADQGLQLERLTVSDKADAPLDRESDRHQSREEHQPRQQSRRRRQQPADATFEVTV